MTRKIVVGSGFGKRNLQKSFGKRASRRGDGPELMLVSVYQIAT
jgi:hypothetical protein